MATVTATYSNERDQRTVLRGIRTMVDKHEKVLKARGVYLPFKYINYADESQDAIGSYGNEAVRRLRQVSRKYDPAQVLQRRVPGKFKLF